MSPPVGIEHLRSCLHLAEMLSGKPLFPGRDYHHQLTLILDVLGTPTMDDFYGIKSRRVSEYMDSVGMVCDSSYWHLG